MSTHHSFPNLLNTCWRWGTYPTWPISPPKSGPATFSVLIDSPHPQAPRRHHYGTKVPVAITLSRGNDASRLQIKQEQVFALTSLLSDNWPQALPVKECKQLGVLAKPYF